MLLDSEGHKPHALSSPISGCQARYGPGVRGGKNYAAAHCQDFQCEGTWRIAQIKLKAVAFLSGSVWLTDLT